jgi:aminoglycoside phosphotransferase (APT) family kinase protein
MAGCGVVLLVPHPERPALLTRAEEPTRLPGAEIEGSFTVPAMLEVIDGLLGRGSPVLRIGYHRMGADGEPSLVSVDLETIGADAPDGLAWTDWASLPTEVLEPAELGSVLPRWIDRRETGPTPADPPWAVAGWLDRVTRWIEARIVEHGLPPTGPPTLIQAWGISMVLRASSATGDVYLKCTSPLFRSEPTLTALLAADTPGLVTPVIATDVDEGWLLMHDLGGPPLGDSPPEAWTPGLEVLATLQRRWADRTEILIEAGAPVRSLDDLMRDLPTYVDREPVRSELRPSERAAWIAALPGFVAACTRLQALGPAPTLSHGDFHPWNVAASPGGPRIFDWSDTAIAHPFLDLAVYATRADDVAARRALRDAYLARWSDALPPADLAEAGDLAIVVGTLYQVEAYTRMLTGLDPDDRGGLTGAARSWTLAAIDALRDGIALERPGHADG